MFLFTSNLPAGVILTHGNLSKVKLDTAVNLEQTSCSDKLTWLTAQQIPGNCGGQTAAALGS